MLTVEEGVGEQSKNKEKMILKMDQLEFVSSTAISRGRHYCSLGAQATRGKGKMSYIEPLGTIISSCASNWSPVLLGGFIPVLCERVGMAPYPSKALA